MNIAFHTGKTAMIAQAQALNVYGNNIANISTYGYQTVRPSFADCLYSTQRATEADWQTGHGAYIQRTGVMFDESSFYYTERPLDFALPNEGFFAVEDRYGDINYTRDGAFAMTQADTGEWYLVSGSGEYVLDYDNNRIVVPFTEDGTAVSVRPSGTEPKIKFYFGVKAPLASVADFDRVQAELDAKIEGIKKDLKLE